MKAIRRTVLLGILVTIAAGADASAQASAERPRSDAAGALAWQLTGTEGNRPYSSDWHNALFGGGSAGWYWTEHHKTEVDFGTSSEMDQYRSRNSVVDRWQVFRTSRLAFSQRTLGISQQYQFFENAWFHPHVAIGAGVTWVRSIEHFEPAYVVPTPVPPDLYEPARTEGPDVKVRLRPFVAVGSKAYMTPRTFFRSDLRLVFDRHGFRESQVRLGVGFDF